jgi:hypothetical protein
MPDADREEPSPSVATLGLSLGISLGVMCRLDFLPALVFLVAGLFVLDFDTWSRRGRQMPISFYIWTSAAVFGASTVVGALGDASYLAHAMPDAVGGVLSPRVFIPMYGLAIGAAILLASSLPTALTRLEASVSRATINKYGRVLAVTLATAWVVFVLWNLLIRPFDSGASQGPTDADNLIRLFSVTSPFPPQSE